MTEEDRNLRNEMAPEPMDKASMDGDKDGMEICIPSKSVATVDEGENAVAPEEGDEVMLSVKAKVLRVEGDNTYLNITEVNGEPTGEPDGDEGAEDKPAGDDTEESLRALMAKGGGM
jgi:hypothetical protein